LFYPGELTRKIPGVASDGEFWLSKVCSAIQQSEQDTKHVVLLEEADEESLELRVKAREAVNPLKVRNVVNEATDC
jgi:DNA polymerase phi